MPSKSAAQARLMAACSHGAGYNSCPPAKVSKEFNQADKGSALLSTAMKHKHASGGSALSTIANEKIGVGRGFMPPVAKMRMPRIPIADTLRNINQKTSGARLALPKLKKAIGGRVQHYDAGGKVALAGRAISVLKDALSHLANKDASSAAATLRSSPEAMAHPHVRTAVNSLRSSTGIGPATRSLTDLVNADTDRTVMPTVSAQKGGGRIHR